MPSIPYPIPTLRLPIIPPQAPEQDLSPALYNRKSAQ
jgi:hypothetical protein